MRKIALMKTDPPRMPLDPGFYGGYQAIELLRLWEFNGRRTVDTFGVSMIEMPWWFQDNMLQWVEMLAWHEADSKAPSADGLPSIETR